MGNPLVMGFRSTRGLRWASLGLGFVLSCSAAQNQTADDAGAAGSSLPSAGSAGTTGGSGNAGSAGAHAGSAGTASAGTSGNAATAGASGSAGAGGALGVAGNAGASAAGAGGSTAGTSGGGAGGATGGGAGAGGGGASGAGAGGGGAGAGGGGASGAGAGGGGASGAGAGGGGASGAGAGGGGASGAGAGGGGAGGTSGGGAGGGAGAGGAGNIGSSYVLNTFVINGQPASTISGTAKITWNANKIEFFFNVKDTTPFDDSVNNWEDDAVEIYLDMNHAKTATYQADDVQIIVPRAAGTLSGIGTVTFASISVVRAEVTGGYTLDVSIPWASLNNAGSQLGKTIGFDIAVDDDLNGGTRDAQLMLLGTDQAYNNTSFFGDLILN